MGTRAAGVLLVAVLAGCGQQGGDRAVTSTPEPPTPAPSSTPPTPVSGPRPTSIPDELQEPLPGPGRRSAGQSISGTVVEGVEAGCLLLSTPDGDYLLMGGDPAVVRAGATLTVRGRADRSVMTTCQQGVPFMVASATPS